MPVRFYFFDRCLVELNTQKEEKCLLTPSLSFSRSEAVQPTAIPSAVTDVLCVGVDYGLAVTWNLPSYAGVDVTQYIVQINNVNSTTEARNITLLGLENFVVEHVTVWAVGAAGISSSSSCSGTPTPPAQIFYQDIEALWENSTVPEIGLYSFKTVICRNYRIMFMTAL